MATAITATKTIEQQLTKERGRKGSLANALATTQGWQKEIHQSLVSTVQASVADLAEVVELIEGYVDVNDGSEGQPVANKAMRATQLLEDIIARLQKVA